MSRNLKLIGMFIPFAVFFILLSAAVNDARHPETLQDQCTISGTGKDAHAENLPKEAFIYKQTENTQNDVSLECQKMGHLVLNDSQLFMTNIKAGQTAWVSKKTYQYLPKRWMVSVKTGDKDVPLIDKIQAEQEQTN